MLFFTSSSPNSDAPSSSSLSSSSSKSDWTHDVFLASDAACYAVSSLQTPSDAGIKGYVDEYELTEKLLYPAIKKSRTVVVVFTKDFVADEAPSLNLKIFEEIMRSHKSSSTSLFSRKVVLAVFRREFDGRELLRAVGFEDAFRRLVAGNAEELRWRAAAAGATVKYCWEMSISTARGSKEMEHIFYFIKNKVDGTDLVLPRRRMGVQRRMDEILHLLKFNPNDNCYMGNSGNDVKIVGIWGIGGIGKTTLAKAIYNNTRQHFMSGSFLANIKNVWGQSTNGQINLQKQLISDVSNEEPEEIHKTEMGIRRLKTTLRDKKALVILDDVSQIEQLKALCGSRDWFGSGSLIVITTRDKHLLDHDFKVEIEYEMNKLDEGESLMLFNAHAFNRSNNPTDDFIDLSKNVISSCEGLPLALKVFGSLLHNKTVPEWESLLEKLKGIPNGQIQEKLKISCDSLANSEKDLFINIACFYVGKSKHHVSQILHGSKLIDVLIERSLVRIDMNDKLDVHDLLQEIAWGTNPHKPEPTRYSYDAFISFRGKDTRKSFATHLYKALKEAGIEVFMDPGLKRGENISSSLFQVIENSRISVIIFSTNYAGSKWCLQELEKIMECHRTKGQEVLPIFYGVQPSEVRKQTNNFGTFDLRITASKEKKLSWKKALTDAANLSGWHSQNFGTEAELIEDVLETIEMKIDDNTNLFVAEHPVGLSTRVQDVMQLLDSNSNEVIIVGIWGMGGIGKTTIAKAIYNKIGRNFDGKSFLANLRRVWEQDNGQVYLQEQLLSGILKTRRVALPNVELGKTIMKERLCHKKALVVLDGVSKVDHLNALCGSREWFGPGSVIIITTRDEHLLKNKILQPVQICNVKEMDINESLKLFSWHAFNEAIPDDFSELSKRIVSYSGGLPLALEILGSYLFGRTLSEWESVVEKLRGIPNGQIHEKLRICYDGLEDRTLKEIFLDICCFFIGKDINFVTQVLNGCGLHAEIGITRLIELSLIKIEKDNKLGIHDLLRDIGREIIRENSPDEPEKHSRLWFRDDVLNVLKNNIGTLETRGLALKLPRDDKREFNTKAFKKMKKLRLLQLHQVNLVGDYELLSKELRWLCWHGCPLNILPLKFSLENIVAMDLKWSKLTQVWKKSQQLERLKFLNLSHSHELTNTPEFSKLPYLEVLKLKDCPRLSTIHPSIGDLKCLHLLNLKDCKGLNHLPRTIYNLKSLKTLNLSGCLKIKKLEEDIERMESLTRLEANQIAVTQLPLSLVKSRHINYVSLCGYEGSSSDLFPSLFWSRNSPTNNPFSLFGLFHLLHLHRYLPLSRGHLSPTNNPTVGSSTSNTSTNAPQEPSRNVGSENSPTSLIIQLGRVNKVIETLLSSLSQAWSDGEPLPGDNYPHWQRFQQEGSTVLFEVPQFIGRRLKGLILNIFCLFTQEVLTMEYPVSVLIANRTKHTLHERNAATTSNEEWNNIISNLEIGNKVEVRVTFACELTVKKTLIYLVYADQEVGRRIMY